MPTNQEIIEVDARGRVSLNKAVHKAGGGEPYKYYFIEVEGNGSIILTPAVVVPRLNGGGKDNASGG